MWKLDDECGKEGGLGMEMRQEEASVVHDVRRLETTENSILNARLDAGCKTGCRMQNWMQGNTCWTWEMLDKGS